MEPCVSSFVFCFCVYESVIDGSLLEVISAMRALSLDAPGLYLTVVMNKLHFTLLDRITWYTWYTNTHTHTNLDAHTLVETEIQMLHLLLSSTIQTNKCSFLS